MEITIKFSTSKKWLKSRERKWLIKECKRWLGGGKIYQYIMSKMRGFK